MRHPGHLRPARGDEEAVVAVGGRLVVGPAGYLTLQAAVCGLIPLAAAAVAVRHRVASADVVDEFPQLDGVAP
ncbi:hypothetical protein OG884_34120 [Streptosporangium sp. NBC_01755]|uniref:hypothetical protein n=1 Tax=unclassified Streptosporangium TaxID=2632669 RepID=UPI002DD9FEDB|nr:MULTISPECIES: hypothetical protein [unclassified Streptosporangium]WSA28767.1 hypothetical protein OIE13_13340 [Streptosporangium sp. NBC_01810]WSC99780.1 hypothetical protein OG884_34120 [Streptosporangium sp. NBC_01755]